MEMWKGIWRGKSGGLAGQCPLTVIFGEAEWGGRWWLTAVKSGGEGRMSYNRMGNLLCNCFNSGICGKIVCCNVGLWERGGGINSRWILQECRWSDRQKGRRRGTVVVRALGETDGRCNSLGRRDDKMIQREGVGG